MKSEASPELAALLDNIVRFIRKFVVLTEAEARAVALWVAHTYSFGAAETTPYLAITSATKRSGKSRLLDVLEVLAANPWRCVTPTEAVVFRKIDATSLTFLLDEVDAIWGRGRDHEGLRALLNAGHRLGATVPRCVGDGTRITVRDFNVFCPKAFAGIGSLPDTVADRSIPIRLERAADGEVQQRFRFGEARSLAAELRADLGEWGKANVEVLAGARPDLPEALDDRAADAWEPLLAIADLAGGSWPLSARDAACRLSAARDDDSSDTIRLLHDIERIFPASCDRVSTTELLRRLAADAEGPWSVFWDSSADAPTVGAPHRLAALLRPLGIRSRSIRLPDGTTPKGFLRSQFHDPWRRYLRRPVAATPPQPASVATLAGGGAAGHKTAVAEGSATDGVGEKRDVADVAGTSKPGALS